MKPARSILCAALAVSLGGVPLTLRAAGPVTTKPAAVAPAAQPQPAGDRVTAQIQAIRQAQDPSAAIQAYHDASVGGPADVAVERAYVARMVDFGLPEMADVQAQEVIRRNPQDGLSWAVAAYMSAKRDQNDLALKDVATAVRLEPGNTFVLRTAGQIAAWYDAQPGQTRTPEEARASLAAIKAQLAGSPAYAEAYRSAGDAYRQLASADAAAPTTQPAAPEEQPWVSTYPYSYRSATAATTQPPADTGVSDETGGYTYTPTYVPPAATYTTYNDYYYTYPNPYVSYPYYSDWWPGPYWGVSWWWPTFGSVVIVDNNFHNHHHEGFHCNDPAFFNHHGHNFNFVHHDGNHGNTTFAHGSHGSTFVGHTRGGTAAFNPRPGHDALASGTPLHRQFVTPSWQRPGHGGSSSVLVPDHRGGGATTFNNRGGGAMSAWTRPSPASAGGGGRHFTPTPMRTAPSGGFSRPAPMPHSPAFGGGGGGGAHFGGGAPSGGGGAHFSGGGGGAHFGGGGGGGGAHFGGGGGGGHFGGGGGGHR
jgi:hypothetical protein